MPVDFEGLLGRRVVLRYRLAAKGPEPGRRPSMTDVLGILDRYDESAVVVRRRDGSVVQVDPSIVLALKAVPPRPVPRREMRLLEQAAALGWQPIERREVGGWTFRAAGGFTKRANSALALRSPLLPIPTMLTEVRTWYAARGLPALVQVVPRLTPDIDAALDRAGWYVVGASRVLTAGIERLPPDSGSSRSVLLEPDASAAWRARYAAGRDTEHVAAHVLSEAPGARLCFASVPDDAGLAGIARGAVAADPEGRTWLGITALEIAPQARRGGLATRLVAALAAWAMRHGAVEAYVQVVEGNDAALGLYDRLGFVEHHSYHYRRLDSPGR